MAQLKEQNHLKKKKNIFILIKKDNEHFKDNKKNFYE